MYVSVAQSVSDSFYPMDCSPLGFSVHGILQARILEWVAIFSPGALHHTGIELPWQVGSLPLNPLRGVPKYRALEAEAELVQWCRLLTLAVSTMPHFS